MMLSYTAAIPTRDRPEELRRALGHILEQKPVPEKIIIVDDGNLDRTELAGWLGEDSGKLIYHKKDRPGLVRSLNKAVDLCPTPWILLLDDDIYLDSDFMSRMTAAIESHTHPERLAGLAGYIVLPEKMRNGFRRRLRLFMERLFLLNGGIEGRFLSSGYCCDYGGCGHVPAHPYSVEHVPGGLGLWRADILRQYHFDEHYLGYAYGNDKDLAYRVSREWDLVCQPASKALHDKSPLSRVNNYQLGKIKIENQFYFYRNHFHKQTLSPLFFAWALFGLFLLDLAGALFSSCFRERLAGVRGMFHALSGVWKGKRT